MHTVDYFIKFEFENKLFERKVKEVEYWHLIRFDIYNSIISAKNNDIDLFPKSSKVSKLNKIIDRIKLIPNFIRFNPLINLKEKDIIVLNHSRKVWNGDYYECIYTDKILDKLRNSYYIFESSYQNKHYKSKNKDNIRYFDYIDLMSELKIVIAERIKLFKLSANELSELNSLIDNINKSFNVQLDKRYYINKIIRRILQYKFRYKYYKKVLTKVNPKILIEVVHYSTTNLIINRIAKEYGIKIIELQHGTMGKYHIAYNFFNKMRILSFPDYIFLFGEYWREYTRLPLKDDRLIVTGFPYFEFKKNKFNKKNTANGIINILFISQGPVGRKLVDIAVKLHQILSKDKYNIIYKLHPREYDTWKERYPSLLNTSICVVDDNKRDIYSFFESCQYQVGVYSTAIFEGIGFNLKTFIVKDYGFEYMEQLINSGNALLVESEEDIVSALNSEENGALNSQKLWAKNSTNNIIARIEELIND